MFTVGIIIIHTLATNSITRTLILYIKPSNPYIHPHTEFKVMAMRDGRERCVLIGSLHTLDFGLFQSIT